MIYIENSNIFFFMHSLVGRYPRGTLTPQFTPLDRHFFSLISFSFSPKGELKR